MGPLKCYHNNRLITLTVITLSGFTVPHLLVTDISFMKLKGRVFSQGLNCGGPQMFELLNFRIV